MPKRQLLLGIWLLATGLVSFTALILGVLLDAQLAHDAQSRTLLWITVALSPAVLLLTGIWLERKLFTPLRHLQIQCARLAANPDARDDFRPEGWLSHLNTDFSRLREGWRNDRAQLETAREAGARDAARIRHELEAVLEVLEVPLLLCDRHQRVLMLNPAAKAFFSDHPALGLGRHLQQLLPLPNLTDTLKKLPTDGSPRQLLLHHDERWLRCDLRRVRANQGEALLTLSDTTEIHASHQRWRQPLAKLLPQLRGHTASLTTTAEALSGSPENIELRNRLEQAMHEESQTMGELIDQLSRVLESLQLDQTCLSDTWSGDLTAALSDLCEQQQIQITPIGIPAWFRADSPTLLVMLETLLPTLGQACQQQVFEIEFCLGNKRVYLDLIWAGKPVSQQQLDRWRELQLSEQPLAPRISDVLSQHNSDWWCLPDHDREHARLRIPLPATDRYAEPDRTTEPRPEFHDFSIAELPPPDSELGNCLLSQLEMVVFDTETTGLKLREGDRVISIGACRILNGRLLANEQFDQLVNPQRDIPAASTAIHGLQDVDVQGAPPIAVVLPRFHSYVGQAILVAHNAAFDLLAIDQPARESGLSFDMPVLDTLLLSRAIDPDLDTHGLDALSERFQISFPAGTRHTALGDARVTAELLLNLLPRLEARGITTLQQALDFQASAETVQVG
ncbi:DNA polymerase III epsilon subunit [Nitrincola lacisaponensis]|uniref:DNA-directed DNA polymerase n=1 Tax=Nitrincola lacisaponensis TaxID=267850 RepID=A0A063Y0X9_9GAMM|nr:3'-5' exonuclease [Nitrincola lacisaponensis]KDE38421.1 DNA polymerase III epsilon subunit [Nitrincola lacisaponensis]